MANAKPKLRVLIIDDSAISVEVASTILEDAGCETHAVDNLGSVQRVFEEIKPHFILADLRMPAVGRNDLAAVLGGIASTPCWIMSAISDAELAGEAARLAAQGWISKNVDPDTFEKSLRALVREAKSRAVSRSINARFLELSIKKLDALESTWQQPTANSADRIEQTRLLVHTLNGDSAMVGFSEFNSICKALEESVNQASPADDAKLQSAVLGAVRVLRELLASRSV